MVSGAEVSKHGKMPQRPGNGVDEDVFLTKEYRWAQDAVGNAQALEAGFELSLPPEVWE
jgi:hypothetical protein